MDEGGFIIDYIVNPPGISLAESDRQLLARRKAILHSIPEVEKFFSDERARLWASRLVEPNTGDFLVKLKPNRLRVSTQAVIADVRR